MYLSSPFASENLESPCLSIKSLTAFRHKEFINAVNGLIGDEELSPQEARGAKRFALASIAGELATDYGITGWEAGEASYGVKECFIQWRADFGKGEQSMPRRSV
jgi:uncharacterized protein (DUF927 family)